jgi:hypothetical protein
MLTVLLLQERERVSASLMLCILGRKSKATPTRTPQTGYDLLIGVNESGRM